MKRPLQLSLAIALALTGTSAMALGLGPVRVMSKLNQPLQAEIPVIQGNPGEAEGLLVSLAAQEDFDRLGISRGNLGVPLEFSVGKDSKGQPVIRVTSKDPVRSTYLDFLIEANWPKGRMLREYTVLLDPPVTAPAAPTRPAVAATAAPASKAKPSHEPAHEKPAQAAPKASPVAHAAPAAPAAAPQAAAGEYGPTKAGETLSGIAGQVRQAGTDVNQMMLALLKSNPNAFYRNNINTLKRGVILRVPSADEVKAIGSATEAAQQVRAQLEDWRGAAAATHVASDAATPASTPAKPAKTASTGTAKAGKGDEHLELVPPKAGKDSLASADRPGAGSHAASSSAESAHELARAKEALVASNQAAGELKSRVKDLEELKAKNEKLISLKDSEIAELQRKLKELQAAKPAPAVPASTTSTPAAATGADKTAGADKKDIWGDTGKAATATDAKGAAPASPASTTETKPAAPSDHAPPLATATPAPADAKPATPAAPTAGEKPATGAAPATTAPATTPAAASAPAGTATTTPLAEAPATTATPTPAKPATPAKPPEKKPTSAAPAPGKRAAPAAAWYEASWVKPAAIGGGVLVLLLGFLGLRKRKAQPAAKAAGTGASIADAFGDTPFGQNPTAAGSPMESEAAELRERIAGDPSDLGAHLELLSIYYAERDVAQFEQAAAQMHAQVADPQQPEWLEVQAMGEELAPHNPLWSSAGATDAHGHDHEYGHAHGHAHEHEHGHGHGMAFGQEQEPASFSFDAEPHTGTAAHAVHDEDTFAATHDYGFGSVAAHGSETAAASSTSAQGFGFDDIPPLEDTHVMPEPEPKLSAISVAAAATPAPAATPGDGFFSDEDAVGTKLDLAKAYMDMGDPDGARSMLEEVVLEGNQAQKDEAQKLIAELR